MLHFSPANTKLRKLYKKRYLQKWLKGRKIYSLDLLSGWSCPFAKLCKSKAVKTAEGFRIQDGPDTQFRCYSASQEAQYPNVYNPRKRNFEVIKSAGTQEKIVRIILDSLPKDVGILRIHSAGDFFSRSYFEAMLEVVRKRPDILFYGYTKAIGYWVKNIDKIPSNLILTASYGGIFDSIIDQFGLRSVKVVKSTYQARKLGLPVDNDDSHAAHPARANQSFALIVHGTQPLGSEYGKVVARNRRG